MSIRPLGPGVKVSGAPGRKGLGTCRSLDHTLQSWELIKVERQFPSLQRGAPLGLPQHTWATWDPVLYHPRPVLGCHAHVPEAGGDDEAGHPSELVDGGLDGGCLVLTARLVLLVPGGSQALRGHHLPEELLGNRGNVIQPCHRSPLCPQPLKSDTGVTV